MRLYNGPSTSPPRWIVRTVRFENTVWGEMPGGIALVGEVAVRRLLPSPSSVEHDPHLLEAIRWVDVAGRALRRTWIAHWRSQYVEILPLAEIPEKTSPPPRPPRSIRSHHRWSWHDRLARNAWWGPPRLRITVAGVPAFLAVSER